MSSAGYFFAPRPTTRAAELATLRIGQRVTLRRAITDRYPIDAMHQPRLAAGTPVQVVALAGHSGNEARYRIETLDARGRRTGYWNHVLESALEAPSGSAMRRRVRSLLAILLPITLAATLVSCSTPGISPAASPTPGVSERPNPSSAASAGEADGPTGPTTPASVSRVVDGDTIHVIGPDGSEATVRYIGVDTPETVHPTKGVQPFGPEASAANHELVEGQSVVLERDVSETDRYGRLLRYVWLQPAPGRWLLVNAELLRRGLAQISTYPPDVKYVDDIYLPAQAAAQAAELGIWSDAAAPASDTPTTAPSASGGECHPDYGACLPITDDLDCGEIDAHNFEARDDDPYGLDNNHDGVACEG